MTCTRIEHGFLCGPDAFVNLAPLGAKVWLSWHRHMGPTFYRSEAAIKPILSPSQKTWDAFGRWYKQEYGGR